MPTDPRQIRASDQDRDRVAAMLREHHAVGRLDAAEFHERLDKAYQAKTLGELDDLTADLPAVDPYPLPSSALPRRPPGPSLPADSVIEAMGQAMGARRLSPAWRAAWASWLSVTLICVVIWVLTGAGYPWPLWVVLPSGAVLAARWIAGTGPGGPGRHLGRGRGRRGIGGPAA